MLHFKEIKRPIGDVILSDLLHWKIFGLYVLFYCRHVLFVWFTYGYAECVFVTLIQAMPIWNQLQCEVLGVQLLLLLPKLSASVFIIMRTFLLFPFSLSVKCKLDIWWNFFVLSPCVVALTVSAFLVVFLFISLLCVNQYGKHACLRHHLDVYCSYSRNYL